MEKEKLEQLIKKTKDRATELLIQTENCAYSPFIALMEATGLLNKNDNNELVIKELMEGIPIGFAGGISGSGHICGALWASIATISMYQKRYVDENNKKSNEPFTLHYISVHNKSKDAFQKFVNILGSPNCKDMNPNFDLSSDEQKKKCTYIVRKSVEITLRELFE